MTRRHFEALATMIRETRATAHSVGWSPEQTINHIESELAYICQETNVNFNRAKFLAACRAECRKES